MNHDTYISAPLDMPAGTLPRVRTTLLNVQGRFGNIGSEVDAAERSEFWTVLSEWSAQNLKAIKAAGSAHGAAADAGASTR